MDHPDLPEGPAASAGVGASNNRAYLIGWTVALIALTIAFLWFAAK